jgi:hypothetical protein
MLLHGKGIEVNKNNLELLAALEEFYKIIAQYDPKNVYNIDKTSLFFQLLLIYTLLMPTRTFQPPKAKRKPKIEFFLSYAPTHWNAQNSMCIVEKLKELACIKDR